jgi:hypothetical protein
VGGKLVGLGRDGAAANIPANGLKGLVEKEIEWIYWVWCLGASNQGCISWHLLYFD